MPQARRPALYWSLRTARVGGIGQPTDVGGGAIAIVGYGLVAASVAVWLAGSSMGDATKKADEPPPLPPPLPGDRRH